MAKKGSATKTAKDETRRVTIKDVAAVAGTSTAAVSAALRGSAGIGSIRLADETAKRIQEAARDLEYAPNPLARGLASGRIGTVGLVFPYSRAFSDRQPYTSEVMAGVFDEVVREKWNVMLHTAVGEDWCQADPRSLVDPRTDGAVLVLPVPNSPVIAYCRARDFPCVAVSYDADSEDVYTVNADDFAGGRMATEHLIRLGHKRIAHLAGTPNVATSQPRSNGYLKAMADAGLECMSEWLVTAGFVYEGGLNETARLLHLPPDQRPTAVFAANDLCADGAMAAARMAGASVPGDLAVVGFDDTWFASMTTPKLTSIHMPIFEMGVVAAQMLISLIEGMPVEPRHVTLPVSLTVRESCGAPEGPRTQA